MSDLYTDLISFVGDYEKAMTPTNGSMNTTIDNHLGLSELEFNKLCVFSKQQCAPLKKVRAASVFIDGFLMAMYLVGRTYDLEYTKYSKEALAAS